MIGFLVVLGWAVALYLLALSRIAPGIKVLVLTAPPVAAVVWLLDVVLEERAVAFVVGAVFLVVLIALNGLLAHPRLPTWTKTTVFGTVPVAAPAWLLVVTADDTLKDPGEDPCSMHYGGVGVSKAFPPQAYCSCGSSVWTQRPPGEPPWRVRPLRRTRRSSRRAGSSPERGAIFSQFIRGFHSPLADPSRIPHKCSPCMARKLDPWGPTGLVRRVRATRLGP